jgi:SAM-dependent methyltransferase
MRSPDERACVPPVDEGRTHFGKTEGGSVLQAEAVAPNRILEISYAFWQSKAILSAVELDVFTVLAAGPLDLGSLTSRIGIHERGARDFLDALVALGLLQRDAHGRYANAPDTDRYLDRGKETYIGGLLKHLNVRHYQNWNLLTPALRSGAPQKGTLAAGYRTFYADDSAQQVFLNGMTAGSLLAARALAAKFPWARYKTVVDIGTAQGCVPVEVARAHPHMTGGGFDLPELASAFASYVRGHGLSGRLQFYPGDFFVDPLPAADVLVMGRILHNWDVAAKNLLISKAYDVLRPGGALIVYDPLIDEARRVPHGLLSSLNMLIETAAGAEYTAEECRGWMEKAGFDEIRVEDLGDMHTAIIGLKHDG